MITQGGGSDQGANSQYFAKVPAFQQLYSGVPACLELVELLEQKASECLNTKHRKWLNRSFSNTGLKQVTGVLRSLRRTAGHAGPTD